MNPSNAPTNRHKPHLPFLIYICITSALGGFLWGFDAIVISGTINAVKEQFSLSAGMEGLFVSSGLIGAVIGSALAGWLGDRFGRSRNLVLAAALMLVSAIASALVPTIELLVLARWIGGLGVGISAMICPLYISEVSPTHLRGRLVTVFQFAITIGIMVALFNNYGLHSWASGLADAELGGFFQWVLVDETWRAMFGSEILPGLLFIVLATTLPESPRWLLKDGQGQKAQAVLDRIFMDGAQEEYAAIEQAIAEEDKSKKRFVDVFAKPYRKPLIIAALLATFSQWSGINVVFYYGTSLLETFGFGADRALSGTAVIGFFNMVFTIVTMVFVDRIGRRKLLLIGTISAIVFLAGIGSMFAADTPGVMLIVLMCGFVACFAFSLGPIKFIFASEIFPTNIRAHAMSIVILVMWTTDTILGQLFPFMRDTFGASGTFYLFALILVPQIFLVLKFMPETANRSLEEIEKDYHG
jgi:SP family arabinose:H+ symporter-like MFS transporter